MRERELVLPDLDRLEAASKPMAKAAGEYMRLRDEERQAGDHLYKLQTDGLEAARQADVDEVSKAVRGRKPIPDEATATRRLEAEIEKADRFYRGVSQALAAQRAELLALVEVEKGAATESLDKRLAEEKKALGAATDVLERAHAMLQETRGMRAWFASFPNVKALKVTGGVLPDLRGPNAEPYSWDSALAAMRLEAHEPSPDSGHAYPTQPTSQQPTPQDDRDPPVMSGTDVMNEAIRQAGARHRFTLREGPIS